MRLVNKLTPIIQFNKAFNKYLPYLNYLQSIISSPDYISVNPNEAETSFELVKIFSENAQAGIKLDAKGDYLSLPLFIL